MRQPIQQQDYSALLAIQRDLRRSILPSRFEQAQETGPRTLHLGLRTVDGLHWLELSWCVEAPRLFRCPPPTRGKGRSTLAQQCQHGLGGQVLVELHQPPWERLLEFRFAPRPDSPIQRRLVLELMGRHSNIFLLDADSRILSIGRQVRASQSRLRPLASGDLYLPPPPRPLAWPDPAAGPDPWRKAVERSHGSLAEALVASHAGVSPLLARQLCDDARLDPAAPPATLSLQAWETLHGAWQQWLQALAGDALGFRPWRAGYRVWPAAGSQDEPEPSSTFPEARYYGPLLLQQQLQRRQQRLEQTLRQALAREQRHLAQQQQRLQGVDEQGRLQRQAHLLMCRSDGQSLGHRRLHLEDPMGGPGETVVLRPELTLIANAQQRYARVRKLRRSVAAIMPRIATHRLRSTALEDHLALLELHGTETDHHNHVALLEDLEEELGRTGLLRRGGGERQGSRRRRGTATRPLELLSPGGVRLQVGRNSLQNDRIALREARSGDLWFHAQELPGSHVVLKAAEAERVESRDLQAAADLAAHFSRGRGSGRVPVVCAASETLQRIPGAGPGLVRLRGYEVLWGVPCHGAAMVADQRQAAMPSLS